MTRFDVLGPLEIRLPAGVLVPRGPMVRKMLALMALRANQIVSFDTFIEELWDGEPPRTAVTTIRTHVYHVRQMMARQGGHTGADLIVTQPAGYMLRLGPGELDAQVFSQLVSEGGELLASDRAREAAEALSKALSMWRGAALANVTAGPVLSCHLVALEEMRIRARELRIEADLRLGRHRELIAELRELVGANPLNEWLHARLIDALRLSGRRNEALTAYHAVRTLLDDELGLQPSEELRQLQQEILMTGVPVGGVAAAG